jgi:hypothetical protein
MTEATGLRPEPSRRPPRSSSKHRSNLKKALSAAESRPDLGSGASQARRLERLTSIVHENSVGGSSRLDGGRWRLVCD